MQPQTNVRTEVLLAVIDTDVVRLLRVDSQSLVSTLLGCVGEDPSTWNEVFQTWDRWRNSDDCPLSVDEVPMEIRDIESTVRSLSRAGHWIAIDLPGKRVFKDARPQQRRTLISAILSDEQATLPPWWEHHQVTDARSLLKPPQKNDIPDPHRAYLWGDGLTWWMADSMIESVRGNSHSGSSGWPGFSAGRYDNTVELHRKWLITPLPHDNRLCPRDCLHVAIDWIDALIDRQVLRFLRGMDVRPLPSGFTSRRWAPPGRHELVVYFQACRVAIEAGWRWLSEHRKVIAHSDQQLLARAIKKAVQSWICEPNELGFSPQVILETERNRVPLIDQTFCRVTGSGTPYRRSDMIVELDVYPLEIDGEFAFSLCSTLEQWTRQQNRWALIDAGIDAAVGIAEPARRRDMPDAADHALPMSR